MSIEATGNRIHALPGALLALQQQRLRQILWVLLAAFLAVTLINLAYARYINASLDLGNIALLLLAYWWNQHGRLLRAAWLMIVGLLLGLTALMMGSGQGMFDEAAMAYPTLLVFAGLFGSKRLLQVLSVLMVVSFLLLFALDRNGILLSVPLPMSGVRVFNFSLIIVVSGFLVWLMVSDLRRVMVDLENEKQALQASHAQIEYLALRDSLTGLPNRVSAKAHLGTVLKSAHGSDRHVAVLLLDLDNFKTINDSLGHVAGDALLCQVADALGLCVGKSGVVARASGDEFFILLDDLQDEAAVTNVVTQLFRTLEQPFTLNGLDVWVTASIGIAMAPQDGNEASTLLKHADLAMYRAKESGRNTFLRFDASMSKGAQEHLRIASHLRHAMTLGQLQLHYQPQFELLSGRIVGAEALLRWQHPEWGMLPPAQFIPIAERSGLIHALGEYVLRQACKDARRWRDLGLLDINVAVNVSPLQFQRGDIEAVITSALADAMLPASTLELELTESSLLADAHHLSNILQRLRGTGIHITIDDFGTGYSNLGYLRRFAVHRLKVDQSFVRRMCSSTHDEGLVRAIIEMAHRLDLQVVAEGVEDAATLARLTAFGCEFGQGFHWSPALPMADFVAFVRAQRPLPLPRD